VRRWRNLLARRGMFWGVPPRPAAAQARLIAAFIQQADRRLAVPRRGRLWGLPQPPPPPAPGPLVARVARHPGRRLIVPRRGQFFPQAAAPSPALALPQMRQAGRRWLPPRRPAAGFAVPAAAASVPPGTARRASRLARPPRGRFFPLPPAAAAPGAPGPLVSPHLRQRRAQPLRIPRGHRSEPPWQGAAAPPPAAIPAQFPRQPPARARLPRRGCIWGVPHASPGIPPQLRRRAVSRAAQPRRGCIFQVPAARPASTSPGPLTAPLIRQAGHRPRWPARLRRSCWWNPPPAAGPPVLYGTARHAAMPLPAARAGDASTTAARAVAGTMTIPRAQGGQFG